MNENDALEGWLLPVLYLLLSVLCHKVRNGTPPRPHPAGQEVLRRTSQNVQQQKTKTKKKDDSRQRRRTLKR